MKKLSIIAVLLACCISLTPSLLTAQERQVFSETMIDYNKYQNFYWNWEGDNSVVPKGWILVVYTATLNYFGETYGRADLSGRDSNSAAVWRTQVVYVESQKTVHLTFPEGLKLEEGGFVEAGFVSEGSGSIFVSLNGKLKRR